MSDNQITKLSGLDIVPDTDNTKITGLYIPQLTTAQINALSTNIVRNGGLVYDVTDNELKVRKNGAWVAITTA